MDIDSPHRYNKTTIETPTPQTFEISKNVIKSDALHTSTSSLPQEQSIITKVYLHAYKLVSKLSNQLNRTIKQRKNFCNCQKFCQRIPLHYKISLILILILIIIASIIILVGNNYHHHKCSIIH